MNLTWSLIRVGQPRKAERLRRTSLEQIASRGFGEYFEPFTGELLGSDDQSWTAAVALDWLASGSKAEAHWADLSLDLLLVYNPKQNGTTAPGDDEWWKEAG